MKRSSARAYASVEDLYKKNQPSYSNAGGFLVEDSKELETKSKRNKNDLDDFDEIFNEAGGFLDDTEDNLICEECSKPFVLSFLHKNFQHPVCDACKNLDEKHILVTRTDAKNEFLLKDCDFDLRKPPLKFISRKNPHNPRWGDMKLYLKLQVEKRAIEIWGSLEALKEAKDKREESKETLKQKRFQKKIKELRKHVRNDLYRKPQSIHLHEYGDEQRNEEDDTFYKICKACQHKISYEKL